ncbi:hypothetical protein SEA_FAYELY_50 [Mycobacterium phage Fayely]|uniref:Uncharacterized protein n=4 Tax=Fromanvirus TaxID=186764 RepID=A0A142K4V8_9CAUD|nr:hypothetical protein PBI_EIDSMOE_50 [Mycobacterium phage Eidsmoe]AOT26168.1 hypothetical protein SEA_QOBBIT_50 [Mycobacterium phage Qobbit]AOY12068.1 hypothetical protein SEA_PHAEDER_50 [Mycobacterium phage Phaeder]AXC35061.1 hypothetical protein SEA_PRIYA_50 [Mycobacterium phage Priya]QDF20153.1 hypothetical protein SEA_TUBS_50 [Mycobacterium phage Tubs]UVF60913.1 hypothetical protein SEA_FAYELY_50 [Mycobacterium phage Fayely]
MSYEDPFATAPANDEPAEEAQQQTAPTAPASVVNVAKDSVSVQHSTDGVSATFKFEGAYSDPWVVVKGADPEDVLTKVNDPKFKELMDRVKQIAAFYGPQNKPATTGGGGGGQRQAPPKAATEAPNGEKKFCKHGEMEYKSGTSKKTGKPYALFSCTAPRDEQCDAQWPSK